jgi:hypothetical protein
MFIDVNSESAVEYFADFADDCDELVDEITQEFRK